MGVAGVHGRVTELARVAQRRYNLALAVVMGRDLDSVICDTKATAQECIAWLRQNQVAPITFFPLDTVRPKVRALLPPAAYLQVTLRTHTLTTESQHEHLGCHDVAHTVLSCAAMSGPACCWAGPRGCGCCRTQPVNERLRLLGGSAKVALDLLEYDPSLERAYLTVCGCAPR